MTISDLYQSAYQHAMQVVSPNDDCALDLSRLLEACFGIDRYSLSAPRGQAQADDARRERFTQLCARYEAGEPLQYLLGEWEFYGLPFEVGPGVLIPRPDTETLVEVGMRLLAGRNEPVAADLCSGSGCVAIAMASQRPDLQCYAIERSKRAVAYLTRNVARNHMKNVHIIAGDALKPPRLLPLDLIVSNPPYIPAKEIPTLSKQVQWEPEVALNGGIDGMDFYRVLPQLYFDLLRVGGAFAFEVGHTQAAAVAEILHQCHYERVATECDLAGIERVVYGFKPAHAVG